MEFNRVTLLALAGLAAAPTVSAQTAWLPEPCQLNLTPGYVFQTFDEAWAGGTRTQLPDDVMLHTFLLNGDYGVTRSIAVDASVGYTGEETDAFGPGGSTDGLADSRAGVRWQFLNEKDTTCPYAPTLAVRAGVIIAGTYAETNPFAPGDGAHGGEVSLLFAKHIGSTGFGVFGDVGYRVRENPVADDFFTTAGVFKTIGPVTASVGYRQVQSLDGMDIGDPGFTYPQLKEENHLLEAGLGFRDKGDRYYQVFGGFNVAGRNTGDKLMLGVSVTIPFHPPRFNTE